MSTPRDDLFQVAALLLQLDQVLNPLDAGELGTFRVDPPPPPTLPTGPTAGGRLEPGERRAAVTRNAVVESPSPSKFRSMSMGPMTAAMMETTAAPTRPVPRPVPRPGARDDQRSPRAPEMSAARDDRAMANIFRPSMPGSASQPRTTTAAPGRREPATVRAAIGPVDSRADEAPESSTPRRARLPRPARWSVERPTPTAPVAQRAPPSETSVHRTAGGLWNEATKAAASGASTPPKPEGAGPRAVPKPRPPLLRRLRNDDSRSNLSSFTPAQHLGTSIVEAEEKTPAGTFTRTPERGVPKRRRPGREVWIESPPDALSCGSPLVMVEESPQEATATRGDDEDGYGSVAEGQHEEGDRTAYGFIAGRGWVPRTPQTLARVERRLTRSLLHRSIRRRR